MVGEMAARNDLIVLNQGRDFTFKRGAGGGAITDLTFATPRLASRIVDWCVGTESGMPRSAADIHPLKG